MLTATMGYYIPAVYVSVRLSNRQRELLKPFPDAMDLLVSSVEAGLGVDAAFQRVAREIEGAAPELARELQMVNHEVAAGISRTDALRRLDKRTGLQEINSLVNVLTQAERFGTSIASSLRVHSELVRSKRMLAAEERAAAISPKLTVGMIIFILPSLFVVLVGPAVINVINNLLPAISQ
jgi:tight adherence protein C